MRQTKNEKMSQRQISLTRRETVTAPLLCFNLFYCAEQLLKGIFFSAKINLVS